MFIQRQNTKSKMKQMIHDHKAHLWKNLLTSFWYLFDELVTNYNDVANTSEIIHDDKKKELLRKAILWQGHLDRVKRIIGYAIKFKHAIIHFHTKCPDYSHLPATWYDWNMLLCICLHVFKFLVYPLLYFNFTQNSGNYVFHGNYS